MRNSLSESTQGPPEALALAVAHLQALPSLEVVGGIQVDIGVAGLLQGPAQEGLHLLVDVLADATHQGLGDRSDLPGPKQGHRPCGWRCRRCRPPSPQPRGRGPPGGGGFSSKGKKLPVRKRRMRRQMSPAGVASKHSRLPLRAPLHSAVRSLRSAPTQPKLVHFANTSATMTWCRISHAPGCVYFSPFKKKHIH
jgi:hypothetical protein